MILTTQFSEVSSAIYNLFLSELVQYIGNIFKKSLSVYDTYFGFYGDLKKSTLRLPYGKFQRKWVKDPLVRFPT